MYVCMTVCMYVFEKHILVNRFMYVLKYEVSHLITGRRVPVNDAMPLLPS